MIASPKTDFDPVDMTQNSNMKVSNSGCIKTSAIKKVKADNLQAFEMFNPLD
jgi:hypothetical protein